MVLAHHGIFSAYGFWLPNEQRGSWSTEVWAPHLIPFGPATTTTERRSLANKPYDRQLRKEAREALLYPAVSFNQAQREAIAVGFGDTICMLDLTVLACAIMPDRAHVVTLRHKLLIEEIIGFLKRAGTRELTRANVHPLGEYRTARGRVPTPWVEHGWHRFLYSIREIIDAVHYVEQNPLKIGLPRQEWSFVTPLQRFLKERGL